MKNTLALPCLKNPDFRHNIRNRKLVLIVGIACLMLVICHGAHAELPDYVLDKDYQSCLGGSTDRARAAYCACIREKMRGWSEQEYITVAMQSVKTGAVSEQVQILAKQCLAGTTH